MVVPEIISHIELSRHMATHTIDLLNRNVVSGMLKTFILFLMALQAYQRLWKNQFTRMRVMAVAALDTSVEHLALEE
jgi:hypothetical protein